MQNYYNASIPPHGGNGLAISLGDDELFGLLDDLEPELVPPHSPERRTSQPAVKGQPRITKKSSRSTLRSRKSIATLKSPPLSSAAVGSAAAKGAGAASMAQSAGAAAGPHAYAMSASLSAKPQGASIAGPAAAAAALKTPIKKEAMNSPSTITVRSTPRTILYTTATASHSHAPSPTPATRLRSTGKVVAPASDRSPAKGVFEKPKHKGRQDSPPVPDMSSAMSQFQVTLNGTAVAQPISVPKPPEKNMQPTSVVGAGGPSAMAANAARASAQLARPQPHFYPAPSPMSANAGALSMNASVQTRQNAQMAAQMNAHANAQMSMTAGAASMRQQRRMNAYWPSQQVPQIQHMPGAQGGAHPHQHAHPHAHPLQHPHPHAAHPHAAHAHPHAHPHAAHPQDIPRYRPPPVHTQSLVAPQYPPGSNISPYSEVGSYSPITDIEAKSLTPPVFSPPVSRSSSIRSPMSEEQWLLENGNMPMPRSTVPMGTPPTPAFSDKVPEFDEFKIDWNEGAVDDNWDVWGFLK